MVHRQIEVCRENALRWFRVGRSPLPPHGLIAPFGTKPNRVWSADTPGQNAHEVIDLSSDSDVDIAGDNAMATGFHRALSATIDDAAAPFAAPAPHSSQGSSPSPDAPLWSGSDELEAWAVSARAY